MNQKTTFAVSVICIVSTTFLVLLSGMLPFLSVLFMAFASVLSAYCFIRCGVTATVINVVVSSLCALLMGGLHPEMLIVPAMGIIPGVVSGVLGRKKSDYYIHLCGTVVSFLLVYVFSMYLSGSMLGGGIGGLFDEIGNAAKLMIKEVPGTQPSVSSEEIVELIDAVVDFLKMVFPSIAIIFSMIIGYIHLVLLKFVMRKFSDARMKYVYFDSHCAPRSMSYVYFVASIFLLLGFDSGTFSVVLNNVIMVLDVILAFCGLSFIESKFKNKLKYGFVRWIIYILVMLVLSNIATQILSIVGMVDSFADFRRIRKTGE